MVGSAAYGYGEARISQRAWPDYWAQSTARVVGAFSAAGLPVIYFQDVPRYPKSPLDCLIRMADIGSDANNCSIERTTATNVELLSAERAALSSLPNVYIVNPTEWLCDYDRCAPMLDGVVTMRDTNHISEAKAHLLTPNVARALKRVMPSLNGSNRTTGDQRS